MRNETREIFIRLKFSFEYFLEDSGKYHRLNIPGKLLEDSV